MQKIKNNKILIFPNSYPTTANSLASLEILGAVRWPATALLPVVALRLSVQMGIAPTKISVSTSVIIIVSITRVTTILTLCIITVMHRAISASTSTIVISSEIRWGRGQVIVILIFIALSYLFCCNGCSFFFNLLLVFIHE